MSSYFAKADAARLPLADGSVDLVFGSPPYEAQRTYSMGFNLSGQAWVDWMVQVFREGLRVCRGLVAMVLEGFTKNYRWSATPALLMADLHRAGINLRKPPIFNRVGIPGSGGPDWLRNDYEFIVCAAPAGKLPWSDNTAMGHPPKWAPGGAMSHRVSSGARVNQWGHSIDSGATVTNSEGVTRSKGKRPGHKFMSMTSRGSRGERKIHGGRRVTSGHKDGDTPNGDTYLPPTLANPGNIITCKVGGGLMGHDLAHENEAPFPERLAEWFIRSWCPPGGTVCDPFSGSGTTVAVAVKHGRHGIGFDIRQSQVELGMRRLAEVQPVMF